MGKLVGLLSSGIGLAMEATSAYGGPNRDTHRANQNNTSYRPRHENQDSSRSIYPQVDDRSDSQYSQYPDRTASPRMALAAARTASTRDIYPQYSDEKRSRDNEEAFQDLQRYANYQQVLSEQINRDRGEEDRYDNDFSSTSYETRPQNHPYDIFPPSQTNDIAYPFSRQAPSTDGLSDPVIIPQRRPGDKSRGWVPAYAPALLSCGISQSTFISFVDAFNEASKSSPYLDAVNVAAMGAGFAPGITPMIISMAVPIGVRMAKGAQTKSQSNAYLAKANKELFAPHGLFAMVMTWKPVNQQQADALDSTNSIEPQLPPTSPLIFPEDNKQYTGFRQAGHFIADYGDRRAQARYAQENPSAATLLGPAPVFQNRFADPTSTSNGGGGLRGLISGNAQDQGGSNRDGRRDRRRARKDEKTQRKGPGLIGGVRGMVAESMGSRTGGMPANGRRPTLIGSAKSMAFGPGNQNQGVIKGIKSIGQETDLLYLMIVNKPTSASISRSSTSVSSSSNFNSDSRYEMPSSPLSGTSYRVPQDSQQLRTRSTNEQNWNRVVVVEEDDMPLGAPPAYSAEPVISRAIVRRKDGSCIPVL